MNIRTIRYFGIACLLLITTTSVFGQILRVQGRHIPPENMRKFMERETTYWAEVAKKAVKDGHLVGWRMYRKIDGLGLDEEPNIFFVNEFTLDQIRSDANIWDFKKVFPDMKMSEIETFSLGTTKSLVYYERLVSVGDTVPKYIRVNYAKTKNFQDLRKYLQLEQTVWQPFIQKQIESGKTNVVSWGLSRVIYPRGHNFEWDAISVDGFASFADSLRSVYDEDVEFPENNEIWDVHHKAMVHVYELVKAVGPEE